MTVPPSTPAGQPPEPVAGDPADLSRMVSQMEARNSVLVRLAGGVERLSREVKDLRRDVNDRPTKASVAHRRRRTLAALMLFGMMLVFLQDENTQSCGPGAQASAILEFAVNRPPDAGPLTQKQIDRVITDTTPATTCDVVFPFHSHGINRENELQSVGPWDLTGWNLFGLALYALLGAMLYLFQRGPDPGAPSRGHRAD